MKNKTDKDQNLTLIGSKHEMPISESDIQETRDIFGWILNIENRHVSLLLWAVLCQDWGETAIFQHPCHTPRGPKTRLLQWRWAGSQTHKNTVIQAHSLNLSWSNTVTACVSEEESEEDEADFLSREVLKRQSQLIIDSKSKRKNWKKKGKFWCDSLHSLKAQ